MPKNPPREPLLAERESTHGDFVVNAYTSQSLKEWLRREPNYHTLNFVQREALDMIILKLSRILSGQPNHRDHWDDIAGYAKLASEVCGE